jgi:Ca2+-binding RTX toxin-like protein
MARATRALIIAIALTAVAPAAAHAASVDLAGSSLRYIANPGEANTVTITSASGLFTITDTSVLSLSAGPGCTVAALTKVTCPTAGVNSVTVDVGDGNDTVNLAGLTIPASVVDGPGNDTVTGGSSNDTFVGSSGDDTLNGGPGNDTFGDAGGAGADTLSGGAGADTADYSSRTVPLTVSLDDQAGDGAAGEGDNVRSDIETVNGGSQADHLIGSAGNDTLRGSGGDDVFDGGGGADTISGGSGNDTMDYSGRTAPVVVTLDGVANDGATGENDNVGTDVDVVLGGAGDDYITGHSGTNELDGNGGSDTLNGGGGNDVLNGGAGDDRLFGDGNDDALHGGDGRDRLDGGAGNDTLDGGADADVLYGGDGTDALDYASRTASVTADLNGTDGFGEPGEGDSVPSRDVEGVYGGAGDDVLTGNGANNVLKGNGGNDTLDGGLGADDVSGGDGVDSYTYASRTTGVTVRLDNGAGDGAYGENDNIRSDIENVTGSRGDDKITGTDAPNVINGNGGNDQIWGNGGDDTIAAGGGFDQIWGGDGNDTLTDSGGGAKIYGENGDDTLTSGAGNDSLDGGAGNDTLDAGSGANTLNGGDGNDTLTASATAPNTLNGGGGDDVLRISGPAGSTLNGNDGNDHITGGDGNDKVYGGNGDDTIDAGAGDDSGDAGAGNDLVTSGAGNDNLTGGDGNDIVSGNDGNDQVHGGSGADVVDGGAGDDQVFGDNDGDRLQGGDGADKLYGGSGDDVEDGGAGADFIDGADGTDTVDYGSRTAAVTITNDGKADDGEKGEGDNVQSTIDNAIGGAGNDKIVFAVDFPHALDGGAGNDTIEGGPQADTLTGGAGNDHLTGDGGHDSYDAGSGADRISSTDGSAETLDCGPGTDITVQDKIDTAVACEHRTIGKLPAPEQPSGPTTPDVTHSPAPGNSIPVSTVTAPAGLVGVQRVTKGRYFTAIPGFPQFKADRRIVPDIEWIIKHYHVAITAAFAMTGHADGGEHPRGLAVDLVPGPGGSWNDVDRLAKWAEPRQNHPRAPFRWVGYNGDPNHGRGNHLHLSWMHAPDAKGVPASWVITLKFRKGAPVSTAHSPTSAGGARGAGALRRYATASNTRLGGHPSYDSGISAIKACSGSDALKPALQAAAHAFGLKWSILAGIASVESAFGCNMGPSSAGAIGWTQFMPGTWKLWGMDADGDHKASPYDSVDAVFSTARYLSASGAPASYRRALYAYNHSWAYVKTVIARSHLFG